MEFFKDIFSCIVVQWICLMFQISKLSFHLFHLYCYSSPWQRHLFALSPDVFSSCSSLSSVQLLSHVRHFATPWTAAHQASLPITNSQSLPKLMSIKSVMPCNHLILYRPLLLLPSIFPSIRVFSNESVLHIRWPKYWSFSFSISSSNEHSGLISFRMDWEGHHHHLSTFPIYALIYCIGVFFLTYFTLYDRLQFHPPH